MIVFLSVHHKVSQILCSLFSHTNRMKCPKSDIIKNGNMVEVSVPHHEIHPSIFLYITHETDQTFNMCFLGYFNESRIIMCIRCSLIHTLFYMTPLFQMMVFKVLAGFIKYSSYNICVNYILWLRLDKDLAYGK